MAREYIVVALAVVYRTLQTINARLLLHYLKNPALWHALRNMRSIGIVEYVRKRSIVPYGFSGPTSWTEDPPTCAHSKRDALPVHVIEMLTRHDTLTGRRLGTSLFITSGTTEERTERKRVYMAGLTREAVEVEYKAHMRTISGSKINTCADALDASCRLTWLIHFDSEPEKPQVEALRTLANAITRGLNGLDAFVPNVSRSRAVLRSAVRRAWKVDEHGDRGMVRKWRDAGMDEEDAYVELAHNVFGMTLQWAHVILNLAIAGGRSDARLATPSDAAHFVLDHLPARVAASRGRWASYCARPRQTFRSREASGGLFCCEEA